MGASHGVHADDEPLDDRDEVFFVYIFGSLLCGQVSFVCFGLFCTYGWVSFVFIVWSFLSVCLGLF